MEAAWPQTDNLNIGTNATKDVCDVSAQTGGPACTRLSRPGVRRLTGDLPYIALVGYSFEGHYRRSEAYLASVDGDEAKLGASDVKPATFQYGKLGGRCARPAP
jgi:hypothetical protein